MRKRRKLYYLIYMKKRHGFFQLLFCSYIFSIIFFIPTFGFNYKKNLKIRLMLLMLFLNVCTGILRKFVESVLEILKNIDLRIVLI